MEYPVFFVHICSTNSTEKEDSRTNSRTNERTKKRGTEILGNELPDIKACGEIG